VAGDVFYIFAGNNGTNSQYLWDFGDQTFLSSGQTVSHIYATPGIYDVHMTVIDTLGCIGESTKQIQITDGEIQVSIQPNPSVNNPIITHNIPQNEAFSFTLYDAAGRKLKEFSNPASPFNIETSGMAEGTYWLQCSYKGQNVSKGLVSIK
jgi:PKD repeat protein